MQLITSEPLHDLRRQSWADSVAGIQSHVALPRLCIKGAAATLAVTQQNRSHLFFLAHRPRRSTHCRCLRRSHPVRRVHGCAGEQASGTVLLAILHRERSNKVFGERLRRDCSLSIRFVYFVFFLYVAMSSEAEKTTAEKLAQEEADADAAK